MRSGCHRGTETFRSGKGRETRACGRNAHHWWSMQPPTVRSRQPHPPPMPPAQGQALLPMAAPPVEAEGTAGSVPLPPQQAAAWEGPSSPPRKGPPCSSPPALGDALGAKPVRGICPKPKSNPLFVGSTATTHPTPPMNISQVLLSPPKSTHQDLARAPRAAPPLPDWVHCPKCFEGVTHKHPQRGQKAAGSAGKGHLGKVRPHCPAAEHQDRLSAGNPGGDFPWSSLKINPMTHNSCCQHRALACWEQPRPHRRTRASVPSLSVPRDTARPCPGHPSGLFSPTAVEFQFWCLSRTEGPQPPPAHRAPSKATAFCPPCWGFGDQRRIFPPQGSQLPHTASVAAKIVVLQPLPASSPSQEHHHPAGKTSRALGSSGQHRAENTTASGAAV